MKRKASIFIILMVLISIALSGCGAGNNASKQNSQTDNQANSSQTTNQGSNSITNSTTSSPAGGTTEKPLAPESNPVGDIPDNQAFIKYESTSGGYLVQVPEGWARTDSGTDVRFIDKFDGVQVQIIKTTDPFSIDNIKKNQVASMEKSGRAVTIKDVKQVKLNGGSAIVVSYESNSDPDPVTNKQVRLENESCYFNKNGSLACVTVWAPFGADNVDQWNFISNSFGHR